MSKTSDEISADVASAKTELKSLEQAVAHSKQHPKLAQAWSRARPFVRLSLYGAAFVGGGLLFARVLGPTMLGSSARRLGELGGRGFAEGVADVQNRLAAVSRGMRFG